MPITTYIDEHERKKLESVNDSEINELFQKVRQKFDNQYFLEEREFIILRFLRKPKKEIRYILYFSISWLEVQIINFASPKSSICTLVDKSTILNYFCGLLNGFDYKPKANAEVLKKLINQSIELGVKPSNLRNEKN